MKLLTLPEDSLYIWHLLFYAYVLEACLCAYLGVQTFDQFEVGINIRNNFKILYTMSRSGAQEKRAQRKDEIKLNAVEMRTLRHIYSKTMSN